MIRDNLKSRKFGRIGVLMGGVSAEREISLKSGKAVFDVLNSDGLEVVPIDIKSDDKISVSYQIGNTNILVAFLALHGKFGEDGSIQSILGDLNIPYTGSGIKASRLAIDKIASRRIFKKAGLNIPSCFALNKKNIYNTQKLRARFKRFPLVVKPCSQGSSIGISFVHTLEELENAISLSFQYDDNIIIENYIPGRELTVGIFDEDTLPIIEIVPKNKFFDFSAKYTVGLTDYIVPAKLPKRIYAIVQNAALLAHKSLGCYGFSRVDMILDKKNNPVILEVNTIPGLTATSLLPKAAKAINIDFKELCLRLIELAYEKRQ